MPSQRWFRRPQVERRRQKQAAPDLPVPPQEAAGAAGAAERTAAAGYHTVGYGLGLRAPVLTAISPGA